MRKYLKISEYAQGIKNRIDKQENEHEFEYNDKIFRSSIHEFEDETINEQQFNFYNTQNQDLKIEDNIIELKDIIIYDDKDIKNPEQTLMYVLECPICLYKTISTENKIEYCIQCENIDFEFDLLAILNKDQVDEIAIDNADISKIVTVKDDKLIIEDFEK